MQNSTLFTFGFPDTISARYRNIVETYEAEGWKVYPCVTTAKGFFGKHIDLLKTYKHLVAKHGKPSGILVCFPGYYLMPIAWILTRFPRKKLFFDAFISVSDTLVSDRKLVSWINPKAWLYYCVDIISCHLADMVLIDTKSHKQFFAKRFFLSPKKIRVEYVGTRKDLFSKGAKERKLHPDAFNILFVGTYIPLQGIEYIIQAAKLLENDPHIHFTLIGKGQTFPEMTTMAQKLHLRNVTFLDPVPLEQLPQFVRSADVALGTFGTSAKASRIIAHKVYDAVACGIPVITAKNDAIEEQFTNGEEVYLCNSGDPQSLAETIQRLQHNLS